MYNKSIPEYQNHTSVVTAVVVYGLANIDHLLSRKGLYQEETRQDK
jgi:carboxypeptidase Q